jgi:hypothetical protein
MPDCRRFRVPGGTYFFTIDLPERRSDFLVGYIDALRRTPGFDDPIIADVEDSGQSGSNTPSLTRLVHRESVLRAYMALTRKSRLRCAQDSAPTRPKVTKFALA